MTTATSLRDSIPNHINGLILFQLHKVQHLEAALKQGCLLDRTFRGGGRYEAEVADKLDMQGTLAAVEESLAYFKTQAPEGFDFDALIEEYAFPVITLTKAGEEYLLGLQSARAN